MNQFLKIAFLFFIIGALLNNQAKTNQDLTMHETFEVNPDIEMLMNHKYYKGVKVKSIKIKKIEINNDTYIKNGKVLEMPPHWISVVIEITDTKGNKTELLGG